MTKTDHHPTEIQDAVVPLRRAITADTLISLSQVGLLVCGVWWISEKLHTIDTRLVAIEERIERRWTSDDMKIWSQSLQIKNPTLVVPEVAIIKAK